MNKMLYIAAALIVIVALFFLLASSSKAYGNQVAIQLTDPPQAPPGTQSLVIAYSNEQLHLSNAGSQSGWVSASESGTIDLLSVVNLSQTIGTVSIPANSKVDMVRLNVSSATIRINGTTYNVTVPSQKVTAHILGGAAVNGSSGILLDLSPTIATIVTNLSTVYVMVPSLKAVVVGGATNSTTLSFGARTRLTPKINYSLQHGGVNISMTSVSLSASGNVTHLSITVRDNSNGSVELKHAGIMGNITVHFNNSAFQLKTNNYINNFTARIPPYCANAHAQQNITARMPAGNYTSNSMMHNMMNKSVHIGSGGEMSMRINSSICTSNGLAAYTQMLRNKALNYSAGLQMQMSHPKALLFFINSNGTLTVPSSEDQFASNELVLGAGQSVTLHFDGVLSGPHGFMTAMIASGSRYKVGVQGEEGARAVTNVTST